MTFREVIMRIIGLINLLLPVLAGIALLVFFWGLVKFISNSGDASSHEDGRKLMVWGVIGLFVMFSFMGILTLISSDLGFGVIQIPRL